MLARYHYFDGLPFHRLVPDFVAQTGSSGIPDCGTGGPGYDQEDIEKPDRAYTVGDVAMARSDAVSGQPVLPGGHRGRRRPADPGGRTTPASAG